MRKTSLNIKFYNPNTPDQTADVLIRMFAKNIADMAVQHPEQFVENGRFVPYPGPDEVA